MRKKLGIKPQSHIDDDEFHMCILLDTLRIQTIIGSPIELVF